MENALERAAVLSEAATLVPENLPASVQKGVAAGFPGRTTDPVTLDAVSMAYILHVLEGTGGNRRRAAAILGISPTTLWRKLKKGGSPP